MGVLSSAAPPVCKVQMRHLHFGLKPEEGGGGGASEPAEGVGGLLPGFCSEPSGKAATYLELGKAGREGPCVAEGEGRGTEEGGREM